MLIALPCPDGETSNRCHGIAGEACCCGNTDGNARILVGLAMKSYWARRSW